MLLITAHTAEQFQENNFVYTGSQDDLEITIFENNYIPKPSGFTYEATFIYLIRRSAQLEIHTDIHELGFFKLQTWLDIVESFDFKVTQLPLESLYEPYLMGEGDYPLTVLVWGDADVDKMLTGDIEVITGYNHRKVVKVVS